MTSCKKSKTAHRTSSRLVVEWTKVQLMLREQLKSYGFVAPSFSQHHEHQKQYLVEILKRTALMGESNSVLIIGPRGSGKSALLESVKNEAFNSGSVKDNMICVELNGLVHGDDHTCLEDMIQQLHLESTTDVGTIVGSFAEKFMSLLRVLNKGNQEKKSVLFVLDEFDSFCYHKKQTLLLNLLDVAQSPQLPVCIIGLTSRIDVMQLLEKRVKSRFTHRLLHMVDNSEFSGYVEVARRVLCLPEGFDDGKFRDEWNDHVKSLMEEAPVKNVLKRQFEYSRSIRDLKQLLLFPVSLLSGNHPKLECGDFIDAFNFNTSDSRCNVLQGLSVVEISLIIAMMHLTEIYDGEPFNFEMVYHEYQKFLLRKSVLQNLNKTVVLKAFEHLQAAELIQPTNGTTANVQKHFRLVKLLVESPDVKEALQRYANLPTALQHWAGSISADI